jgi:hypothetical protein
MSPQFHLATVALPEPVTVYLPPGGIRPRVVAPGGSAGSISYGPENGAETVFEHLDCAFWVNLITRSIHAQIGRIPNPLPLYGPEDFSAVAADTPEQHGERVLQCLGSDPASALQALVNAQPLPPMPARVPREIANWRARAVLELAGLLATVEAAIAGMTGPEGTVVRNAWQSGAPLARRGPTVSGLAPALGLTEAQVDAMFIQAEALSV